MRSAWPAGARRASPYLFVDLDKLKQVNDKLGHASGDAVVQMAARRIASVVRDSDTVSRHGGDEFLVLLTEISQPSDATLIATKMLAALAAPNCLAGQELRLSASIGITVYPEDGEEAATLISRADAAMYCCKRGGGGGFALYAARGERESGTTVNAESL